MDAFFKSGVEISQGGIDEIMKRAGKQALQKARVLEEAVRQSAVIHCDETGSRVEGANWWEWVFCTAKTVLHVIRFNRSADVIHTLIGSHEAVVWVSDCLLAPGSAPKINLVNRDILGELSPFYQPIVRTRARILVPLRRRLETLDDRTR